MDINTYCGLLNICFVASASLKEDVFLCSSEEVKKALLILSELFDRERLITNDFMDNCMLLWGAIKCQNIQSEYQILLTKKERLWLKLVYNTWKVNKSQELFLEFARTMNKEDVKALLN